MPSKKFTISVSAAISLPEGFDAVGALVNDAVVGAKEIHGLGG